MLFSNFKFPPLVLSDFCQWKSDINPTLDKKRWEFPRYITDNFVLFATRVTSLKIPINELTTVRLCGGFRDFCFDFKTLLSLLLSSRHAFVTLPCHNTVRLLLFEVKVQWP